MFGKKKVFKIFSVLFAFIILVLVINNITIFRMTTKPAEEVFNRISAEYNLDQVDVSIIKYHSVTGASWFVEKSTDKTLENRNVCLCSVLYPRQLKVNRDFELDYFAKYIVITPKTEEYIEIAKEKIEILYPEKYIISYYDENDGNDHFKIKDLSFKGKWNALVSLFVHKYRIRY